jgi:hypothetical protein
MLSSENLLSQNNLAIIDSLVTEVTKDLIDSSKNEFQDNVVLKVSEIDRNIGGYLISKIGNILTENNYQVFRNFPKDTSFENTVFEVQNCGIWINYSEPYSMEILDETLVQRIIILKIDGQIHNHADGKVILPVKIEKKFIDEIIYSEIDLLEESPFEFTFGTRSGITFWQGILEPVIVVSSVLVVLLLLFTQRS